MKTALAAALSFLIATTLHAQGTSSTSLPAGKQPPSDTPWEVVARGSHYNLWQRTDYEVTSSGQSLPHVHNYQEVATGLNYFDTLTSQYLPSSEEITPTAAGAAVLTGQHKVSFASDLATVGAIQMQTPDGLQLSSHLLGLAYQDLASGKSVFIAVVTNSLGQIIAPNQVWYNNAVVGSVSAGVLYTYTRAGFEQNVVIQTRPPLPEAFGLSSTSTVLQAVTEFISPPKPVVTINSAPEGRGHGIARPASDQTLGFGAMQIGRGRAFLMGNESESVPVSKEWVMQNGRSFLLEQIPVADIAEQLDTLPVSQTSASIKPSQNSVLNTVSNKHLYPPAPLARTSNTKSMKLAAMSLRQPGFILDYTALNTSQSNEVFQGYMTYYFTGNVNVYGTNTVFEGATVLKFSPNVSLTVDTPVTWTGAFYHPVVMAAKDDNTVGEIISGSTGNPGKNFYASTALFFDGTSALTNLNIENLRIANANVGVVLNGQSGHVLNDVQLINCGTGIAATNTDFGLHNALFWNVSTNFNGNNATGRVEHLTSDTALWLNQNITNLSLTNCLLAAVTNLSSCTSDHVAVISTNNGIFQVVGAASHYLPINSPYHNAGTNGLSAAMLAALKQKTTYAPTVYASTNISATEFAPLVMRDTNSAPDLGYHYDPMDWVFGGDTANGNLTFDAGTAVGYFETVSGNGYGIALSNNVTNTFNGTVTAPCVFARYSSVQEGGNGNWPLKGYLAGMSTVGNSSYYAEIDAKFLHCYALAGDPGHIRDYYARMDVHLNDCELRSGAMAGYWLGLYMTNCLFDRQGALGSQQRSDGQYWRNCTMHGGMVFIQHTWNCCWPVWIENCVFDGVTMQMDGGTTNITYANFNAFINGSQRLSIQGSNDIVISNGFTWQTGPLGTYYEPPPPGDPLIDAGSVTADKVGLYHFTTQTNETIEGTSQVDIGYHYVALDSNGNPLDTNGDGIPDYLEDANGNGIYDAGDLGDWLISPYNGLSRTNGLTVFTPLK